MTLIRVQKNPLLVTWLLLGLFAFVLVSAVVLIFFYNRAVDLNRRASEMNTDIKKLEVESAELQREIFSLFTREQVDEFSASRGLVQDRKPHFIEVVNPWSVASR